MVSESFDSEVPLCLQRVQSKGWTVGDFIRRGTDGAVYWSSTGKVIKVTESSLEKDVATFILDNHSHPHFPIIYGVEECSPLYAILREDVPDIFNLSDACANAIVILSYTEPTKERLKEKLEAAFTRVHSDSERQQLLSFARFVIWCESEGIKLNDLGYGLDNLGQRRDGTIVVRDFSKFYFQPTVPGLDEDAD